MEKQCLENVLEMSLTDEQVEYLKDGWKAFYDNPTMYKDSVVINMVKQGLNEKFNKS